MLRNPSRGAALVSATWLFVVGLLAVLGFALAGMKWSEAGKLTASLSSAESAQQDAQNDLASAKEDMKSLSAVVGFAGPDNPELGPQKGAIETRLKNLREDGTNELGGDVASLERALEVLVTSYNSKVTALNKAQADYATAMDEAAQARSTTTQVTSQKDGVIDGLRQELSDANDRHTAEIGNKDQRISTLTSQIRDLDDQMRQIQNEMERRSFEASKEITLLKTRIEQMRRKVALNKEPARPNGRVLSVSEKLGLVYVDLGTRNRMRRGMRFEVKDAGVNAASGAKGMVEVTEVFPEYSEAKIVSMDDQFYPMAIGDEVRNPFYDPHGEKRAVLVGRFSGRFNRSQLATLLKEVGINVQEKVDVTTDYLILGYEEIVEGEPVSFEQNEQYKKAENLGVDIFPLRRIESFFAY